MRGTHAEARPAAVGVVVVGRLYAPAAAPSRMGRRAPRPGARPGARLEPWRPSCRVGTIDGQAAVVEQGRRTWTYNAGTPRGRLFRRARVRQPVPRRGAHLLHPPQRRTIQATGSTMATRPGACAPDETGEWRYRTESSDAGLDGHEGTFAACPRSAVPARPSGRGHLSTPTAPPLSHQHASLPHDRAGRGWTPYGTSRRTTSSACCSSWAASPAPRPGCSGPTSISTATTWRRFAPSYCICPPPRG